MEADKQKLDLVIEIPVAQVFKVDGATKKLLEEGVLQIAEVEKSKCYLMSIGKFKYSLSNEIPVLAKRLGATETLYILPDVEGHIGLHLPDDTKDLDLFEAVLKDVCNLAYEKENIHEISETPQEATEFVRQRSHPEEEREIVKKEGEQEGDVSYISQFISNAGDFLKDGVAKVAILAAGGIAQAATYLSEKVIGKGDEYKMWGITSKTIEGAKNLTDKAVNFKSAHVSNAINRTAKIAFKLQHYFETGYATKGIAETGAYKSAKEVGTAAIFATAGVYDAMSDAMDTLSGSFSKATTDIVTQRYGERAGKAAGHVMDAWGNIGKLFKSVKQGTAQSLAKGIREAREQEIAKEAEKLEKERAKSPTPHTFKF